MKNPHLKILASYLCLVLLTLFYKDTEGITTQEITAGLVNIPNQDELPCCVNGDQFFHSLDDGLYNLTSNSFIKITKDVKLH